MPAGGADGGGTTDALYDVLLPGLNDRPFLSNATATAYSGGALWQSPPLSGDSSRGVCVHVALTAALTAAGYTHAQAAYATLIWRWSALQHALAALEVDGGARLISRPDGSDALLLRAACRHLASEASRLCEGGLPLSAAHAALLEHTVTRVDDALGAARQAGAPPLPPRLSLSAADAGADLASFPLFGRVLNGRDVEHLAGRSAPPPLVLPIELSRVPDSVATYNDVCDALRRTVQLCELLAHQVMPLPILTTQHALTHSLGARAPDGPRGEHVLRARLAHPAPRHERHPAAAAA